MAIAGRVAIVPKGDWRTDATYKRLDAVTYNNTLYFAKKDVPAGTATSNTEYWSKSIVGNPDKSSDQQGQNLISYPYYSKSNTNNGITWTVNDDGTVTANGTATKESAFNIISPFDAKSRKTLELNQKYVLSDGTNDKTKAYTQFVRFNASENTYNYGISSRAGYNTWTASDENLLSYGIRLIVANGATVNNVVFKPMLEIGTVSHEYQSTTISNITLGEKVDSFKQYEPDGKSMSVDESGTLSINLDGTTITLDEAKNVIKLADTLKKKINGAFPAANLINNLTTTEAGFGLDARQGKALDDKITEINGSLKTYEMKILSIVDSNFATANRCGCFLIQKRWILLSGEIDADFTNVKNYASYTALKSPVVPFSNTTFTVVDEDGMCYTGIFYADGRIDFAIRSYIPESKKQILRFSCISFASI